MVVSRRCPSRVQYSHLAESRRQMSEFEEVEMARIQKAESERRGPF